VRVVVLAIALLFTALLAIGVVGSMRHPPRR